MPRRRDGRTFLVSTSEQEDVMRTRRAASALAAVALSGGLLVATPTAAGAAYCGQVWGSTPEARTQMSAATLTGVRSGRHACFDRLVLDLRGRVAGYDVRYVPQVTMDGSGQLVPLRGGARIQLVVTAPAHDANGVLTYRPASRRELVDVSGYRTLRQVAWAGTFEGYTTLGVGVRARLPFRVFVLSGPGDGSRLVLDVAHLW
jgi:hypothetical protein